MEYHRFSCAVIAMLIPVADSIEMSFSSWWDQSQHINELLMCFNLDFNDLKFCEWSKALMQASSKKQHQNAENNMWSTRTL